jgi:hypothetical protein
VGFRNRTDAACASVAVAGRYDVETQQRGPQNDPDACTLEALETARAMPHGPAQTDALKKAGLLLRSDAL